MKNGPLTVITCDTHALLYWAFTPRLLSPTAAEILELGRLEGTLGCADIVLWEIAMLHNKRRIVLPAPIGRFLDRLVRALQLQVLPISPAIAVRAQDSMFQHGDPADRLIAATAMEFNAPLITHDRKLTHITGLRVLW